MSDFDPYYKWLSIPPEEQPPTHYRLLGVQMLEQNAEVIEAAANRQMAYLQELSSGNDHIDEAQGLLGEVARARVCLLTAESKARYDAELVSTLDSLPEAEEEASAPQAEPIVNASRTPKPSSARRSSSTARRKTTSGSRGHSSGSKKSISRKKINTGDSTKESSSLAIKIVAAVVPAVLVLIIGVILMSGGGGEKNKANNISNSETAGRSSQSDAGKGVPKSTEAEKKKTDLDLEKKLARFKDGSSKRSAPKPRDESIEPATISSIPAEQTSPTEETTSTEIIASEIPETELPEEDKARRRLKNQYELEEEDFEHTWHLANEQTRKLEALETSRSSGNTGGAEFEAELKRRVDAKKKAILQRWSQIWNAPSDNNGPLDREWNHIVNTGVVMFPNNPSAWHVRDEVPEITSIRTQVEQEFASRKPATVDPGKIQLIKDIRTRYAELTQNAEVIGLLEKAGGTLAEAPKVPEAARDMAEQTVSLPADNTNAPQDDVASAKEPASAEEDGATDGDDAPETPVVNYEELKKQLTDLEKETKLAFGKFNKGAKGYLKQKKELSKQIKTGEKLHASGVARLGRMPEYTEAQRLQKREAGKEFEKKISGPLKALKSDRDKIAKPKAATPLEEKLKQGEKLTKQIKATPEYAANPKSIDSLAEKIAKYRRGFEVQQTKMAK